MAYYPKEEQETVLLYDTLAGSWRVSSSCPKHIRKLKQTAEVITHERTDDEGRTIEITGYCRPNQVRFYR